MAERKLEKVTLTNMCMVYDKSNDSVVAIKRVKSWPGITFPGGHIEPGESITESVIREIKEETGLDIQSPKLVGVKDFVTKGTNERFIVFFYRATEFSGELVQNDDEGEVFWTPIATFKELDLCHGFIDEVDLFFKEQLSEVFSTYEQNKLVDRKKY